MLELHAGTDEAEGRSSEHGRWMAEALGQRGSEPGWRRRRMTTVEVVGGCRGVVGSRQGCSSIFIARWAGAWLKYMA